MTANRFPISFDDGSVALAVRAGPGVDLAPQHTRSVLAPAPAGGIGPWVATVADALAGGNRSVALVAAGGEPAWAAVSAQMAAGRQVLVVSHSGGVADHLSAAAAGRPADERAAPLARSGRVHPV